MVLGEVARGEEPGDAEQERDRRDEDRTDTARRRWRGRRLGRGLLRWLRRAGALRLLLRRRPEELALVEHHGAAVDLVLEVEHDVALVLVPDVFEEVVDGGGVELARLRGHAAREVGVADDEHAELLRDLVALGEGAVAALLGREVHDHRAVLHAHDRAGRDELRRGHAGHDGRRDDDVRVLGVLGDEGLLGRDVGLAHLLGVAALALARLVELELEELGAEALDLFLHRGPRVERLHDRAERARRGDGGEPRDARAHDEHLRGLHPSGRRHLPREKAWERGRSLDDRAVTDGVRRRAERVHLLRAGDARHAVHPEHRGLARRELLDDGFVDRWP